MQLLKNAQIFKFCVIHYASRPGGECDSCHINPAAVNIPASWILRKDGRYLINMGLLCTASLPDPEHPGSYVGVLMHLRDTDMGELI